MKENNLHQHFGGFLLKNKKNNMKEKNENAVAMGKIGGKKRWENIGVDKRKKMMRDLYKKKMLKKKLTDSK